LQFTEYQGTTGQFLNVFPNLCATVQQHSHESTSLAVIKSQMEEAGYELVNTETFLPEDLIFILEKKH